MEQRGEGRTGGITKLFKVNKNHLWIYVLALFFMLSINLIFLFNHEKKDAWRETENLLKSVNALKTHQIKAWLEDELTDATSISNNQHLKHAIINNLSESTFESKNLIKAILRQKNDEHDNLASQLYDLQGRQIASSGDTIIFNQDLLLNTINQTIIEKTSQSSDLYRDIITNEILIHFTAPVFNNNHELIAVLVFTQNAGKVILSAIEIWPLISKSGETMVVKRTSDSIILINHSKVNDALPLDSVLISDYKTKLILNQNLLTEKLIQFKDYREKNVLGYISAIEGKSWLLISKEDTAEIYSRLKSKFIIISGISLLIFSLLTLGLIVLFNKRQKDIYRKLYLSKVTLLKAQNRIVENEKILSSIYNATSEVIITIDVPERIIVHSNKAIEQVFGWKPSEVIGKSTSMFFPSHDEWERTSEAMLNAFKNKMDYCKTERKLINKNNKTIYCEIHTSFIYYENNKVKAVSVYHDITEKKQLIEELISARIKAENKEKLKSMFLADIAHEVRSPLNGVLGFTQLLMSPCIKPESQKHYLEIIKKTGERMSATINDIMELSRIEAGATELKLREVNINQMTNYFYNFFKPEAEAKDLEFRLNNQLKDSDNFIITDKNKLESIISNLLKNAIKYTLEGFIELEVKKVDNNLLYIIRDSGLGISSEKKDEIFYRFVQVERTQAGRYDGLGIGLSIAKSYADMIGGKICLESVEGEGSVFYFTLPIQVE